MNTARTLLAAACLSTLLLAGCVSDEEPNTEPTPGSEEWGSAIVPGPMGPFSMFEDGLAVETPVELRGIWLDDGVLYASSRAGLTIYDVRDPGAPVELAHIQNATAPDGTEFAMVGRDVDIIHWQDRTYAALADAGAVPAELRGIHLIDVTDPTAPAYVSTADVSTHNLAVVPGTPYIYSATASGNIQTVDITDPAAPTVHIIEYPTTVGNVPVTSDGCHDISVRVDLGRAYCAGGGSMYVTGGGETFILDISDDPLDPVWVAMLDDPRIVYHHQAFASADGDYLIVDDEYVGNYPYTNIVLGASPAGNPVGGANNCVAVDTPLPGPLSSEDQFPIAAAWIWDIRDESNPVLLSHIQNDFGWDGTGTPPNVFDGNCGSHFGGLVEGQDAFVMGWYDGGTLLVDFSDPAAPVLLDRAEAVDGETWDAQYWNGHVFHGSGDLVITPLA